MIVLQRYNNNNNTHSVNYIYIHVFPVLINLCAHARSRFARIIIICAYLSYFVNSDEILKYDLKKKKKNRKVFVRNI